MPAPAAPKAAEDDSEIAAIMGAIAAIMAAEGVSEYVIQSITPVKKRVRKPLSAWASAGIADNTAPF